MTVRRSEYELRPNELYETPRWVTEALLRHVKVKGKLIWEPAAGNHKIANVLREEGAQVICSDIVTYEQPQTFHADFLEMETPLLKPRHDIIITNPPYGPQNRLATRWVRRALEVCDGWVCILCTATFDSGKSRQDLFRDNRRYAGKIVLFDRIDWFGRQEGKGGNTVDHAWYLYRPFDFIPSLPVLMYEGITPRAAGK